jgi:hypothetical protein
MGCRPRIGRSSNEVTEPAFHRPTVSFCLIAGTFWHRKGRFLVAGDEERRGKMVAEKRRERPPKPRRDKEAPKPGEAGSQGIVLDQRGQEQPADKERAQQTGKSERDR